MKFAMLMCRGGEGDILASSKHMESWEKTSRVGKHKEQPIGFPTLFECSRNFPSV